MTMTPFHNSLLDSRLGSADGGPSPTLRECTVIGDGTAMYGITRDSTGASTTRQRPHDDTTSGASTRFHLPKHKTKRPSPATTARPAQNRSQSNVPLVACCGTKAMALERRAKRRATTVFMVEFLLDNDGVYVSVDGQRKLAADFTQHRVDRQRDEKTHV